MASITILDSHQTEVNTNDLTSFVIEKSQLLQNLNVVKLNTKISKVAVKEHADYILKTATLVKNRLQIRFDLTTETLEDTVQGLVDRNVAELLARLTEYVILNARSDTDFLGGVYGVGFDGLLVPSSSTGTSTQLVPTLSSFTYSKLFATAAELPEKVRSGNLIAITSPMYASNLVMRSGHDKVKEPLKVVRSFEMPKPLYDHTPRAVVLNKDVVLVGLSSVVENSRFLVESQKTVYCVRLDLDLVSAVSGVSGLILTNGGTNPDPVSSGDLTVTASGAEETLTLEQLLTGVTADSGETLSISNLQIISGSGELENSV